MLITGAIYFIGMLVFTGLFNVPLNNLLAGLNNDNTNAEDVWYHYLRTWTRWNQIRTVSSLTTCGLCIWLLTAQ